LDILKVFEVWSLNQTHGPTNVLFFPKPTNTSNERS